MNIRKIKTAQPVSFNGIFKAGGCTEALDEICWHLRNVRKQRTPEIFDFVDFRITHTPRSGVKQVLGEYNPDTEEALRQIESALRIQKRTKSKKPVANTDTVDVFITNDDKKFAENNLGNVVIDPYSRFIGGMPLQAMSKLLVKLIDLREALSSGRPIPNIPFEKIQRFLIKTNIEEVPTLNAEQVLKGFQENDFDVVNGVFSPAH